MHPESFNTQSLLAHPHGAAIRRVLAAALDAVDPYTAVLRSLRREGHLLQAGGQTYDLARLRRVIVVGAGKAGTPMARAVSDLLGARISAGLVVVKDGHGLQNAPLPRIEICEAAHPVPDERGAAAGRRIQSLLAGLTADDLVICLLSGGGSALLTAPAEGISLSDLQALTRSLLACGATINEINTLRKHLDLVKGGGLARWAAPARVLTLILSDVIGDPLDVIASGPCVPDSSTFAQAADILTRYSLSRQTPASIQARLQAGLRTDLPENPAPGDPLFDSVTNLVIGSNTLAARAALSQAEAEGWRGLLLTTSLQGEAAQVGARFAALARQVCASGEPLPRPCCLMAGGETTVTLKYSSNGLGGRNQELALSAVNALAGLQGACLVALATDGGDGPTDAAGAVVTGGTLARAAALGLSPQSFLEAHDSYHFFQPLGDLLLPGPTLTNVNDLLFAFML